ncbi:MAG: hypothetical protein A2Y38_22945 [Spirochaetes bacterium GWB1_59_5]|nr:MAG: hypothetical protein A2Y38_22945 [Spirochaetes bacterium GWB1_59_5]
MATLVINLERACGGGEHLDIGITVDGGPKRIVEVSRSEMTAPLTDTTMVEVIRGIVRAYAKGKTQAQVRTALQAGITVVI